MISGKNTKSAIHLAAVIECDLLMADEQSRTNPLYWLEVASRRVVKLAALVEALRLQAIADHEQKNRKD